MSDENKPIGADVSGYEVLTEAVRSLLNQYPDLDGKIIKYEELTNNSGIAFSNDNGALVMTEKRSITDHVKQICQYPFYVVYRVASTKESQKLMVQAFLDKLGKWLCKEPIEIDCETVRLTGYPSLSDGRKITRITRGNSYGLAPSDNGTQEWLMPVTVQYTNEFDMY